MEPLHKDAVKLTWHEPVKLELDVKQEEDEFRLCVSGMCYVWVGLPCLMNVACHMSCIISWQ